MKILVVVLNYRTPGLTVRCLESLQHEVDEIGAMRVVVADNNSGDSSVEEIGHAIKANDWRWCSLMPLLHNGGYSFGNNAGMRPYLNSKHAPHYVMLINPDAYVCKSAIQTLLRFMESRPDVGIAGPRIEDGEGRLANSAFRFPSVGTEFVNGFRLGILNRILKNWQLPYELTDAPTSVDWLSGAAIMIRTEVLNDIGLLDEEYFLYFDEVDFCFRARNAGWPAYYVPESLVVHLQAQATGITHDREDKRRFPDYWFESRRRFFLKNRGNVHAGLADVAFLAGYTTFRIRSVLQRKPNKEPPWFWYDFTSNCTLIKGFRLQSTHGRRDPEDCGAQNGV